MGPDKQRELAVHGIPQFARTGFDTWKFRVQIHLEAWKVWDTVVKDGPADDKEAAKFQEMDAKAKAILVSLISDEYLGCIRGKSLR